jgi:hypothetical protein
MVWDQGAQQSGTLAAMIKKHNASEVYGFKPFPKGSPPSKLEWVNAPLFLTDFEDEVSKIAAAVAAVPFMKLLWAFAFKEKDSKLVPQGMVLLSDKQLLLEAGKTKQLPF